METLIFPCTDLAERIQTRTQESANEFAARFGRRPCLAVILVGNDAGSEVYVRNKGMSCKKYGIDHKDFRLQESDGFAKLVQIVQELNRDKTVDGILVQSPLPKGWSEEEIQSLIDPAKDVDGFHPQNVGELLLHTRRTLDQGLAPCTPAGVIEVLKDRGITMRGKHAVVVGRSNIVGKPMGLMLLAHDATVTYCHSHTPDLAKITSQADILISAIGKARAIGRNHVKHGAAVIDVGICRETKDGKTSIVGDVDAKALMGHAGLVTPVPKGIGPMTIALLLRNTVRAAWHIGTGHSPL